MDDNQCRICLREVNDSRLSVFKRVNGIPLDEQLQFVTGLKITQEDNFSKLLCIKCFNDTCTAYALKTKCLDTDRTLKNLERKFQTRLEEKVQEIILKNDIRKNFVEIEQFEIESDIKEESVVPMVIEEDSKEATELFETEDEVPAQYEVVVEEYLESDPSNETTELVQSKEVEFENIQIVATPQQVSTRRQNLSCDICKPPVSFQYEISLKSHEWEHHQIGTSDPLVCVTCNYAFDCQSFSTELLSRNINKHNTAHVAGKNFSCMFCPEVFDSKVLRREHRNRHHTKQTANKCKACHTEFPSHHQLKMHLVSTTCKESHEKPFKCYICEEIFSMGIAKKKHIQTVHKDKAGADCPLCLRCKIPSAVAFENHYKTHFELPRFYCSFCGRSFYESDRLYTHIRRTHENSKLSCNWCDKTFRDKSGIARHILGVHFNQRNHRCNICSKAFTASYNLKEHMFSVHKSASKYYTCESCSQVFLYRKQFERHRGSCSGIPEKRRR